MAANFQLQGGQIESSTNTDYPVEITGQMVLIINNDKSTNALFGL